MDDRFSNGTEDAATKKKLFVVYEVWTRSRVVEGYDEDDVLASNEPEPIPGMNLANWHAVEATLD